MKSAKRIYVFIIAAVMILSLCACEKTPAEQLIGKWNMDVKSFFIAMGADESQLDPAQTEFSQVAGSVEFTKDGRVITTMTVDGKTTVDEKTYTVEGDKITIDGQVSQFVIVKKSMTLANPDGTLLMLTKD